MAEWKKVIVSGSTAALAAANVDGTVTANAFSGDGSNLTNVPAGSINIESFTDGTGITVANTDKLILSDAGTEKYINVSQLPFTNDTNTFRGVRIDTNGDGDANNTLGASETLTFKKGNNITLAEADGVITISSTDTNTNTQLSTADVRGKISGTGLISYNSGTGVISTTANNYSMGIGIDGGEATAVSSGNAIDLVGGTNVTLTQDGNQVTITSTDTNTDTNTQLSTAQVRSKISGTGLISYNSTSGVISTTANNYSLPAGSSSTRGGFKIGYAESGKNYPVEVSSEKMYVNVPWTDTNTDTGFRTIRTVNGETNTTLGSTESLTITAGTNVSLSESEGNITISSTDTNTNTQLSTADVRGKISGTGLIGYNSSTGVISTTANNYSLSAADVKSVLGGGMPSNALTIGDSNDTITIAGNLDVNGTTTTIDTTNLAVTDKFIELNRGATSEGDGGIVINGATNKSFGWDDSNDRWAFDFTGATAGQTTIDTDAFAAAVAKTKTDTNYQKNGNLHVDGTDIWIYVE